ncbi:probable folate-biopterin transporter 2 [Dioscorea cayenensis subsp. rotundata]|uniref:Probable folate-biopterin transporter 2 n=1 Tax=Dioscorea cayennensis subsp. rotundata TaxID=55577 RepID=A0AB40BSW4_DIOCR|nr:probable folate-biopterin transporter 2 [Dioscorea cayenensis subsp. rotundata]XP_039130255.1 probable folate-biopterin transporter 2 [Dioscorea cayenensis subsp. rotundata]XP_039130256.1 probable folate-biopterin transporter 2 [Dioscorea cayenensis subsp. rotundata]
MESAPTSQASVDEERAEEGEAVSLVRQDSEESGAKAEGWLCASLSSPVHWFLMLADETHWSFVFGVVTVYGISQGFGGAISRVASDYYWKDVQMVQPSEAQVYQGIASLPWIVKPLWGLLTDVLPVAGYRRRPYFILSGLLGVISMLILSLHKKLHVLFAILALTAGSAGVAISDVTIDACVAQNSISHPTLAADMQSLCGLNASIGRLLGFSISGLLVHAIGPQGVLGLLSVPAALVFSVGIVLKEWRIPNFVYGQVHEKFLQATRSMWSTLKYPNVWRPCLYMYFSFALSLKIQEGMFYWYTDKNAGPSFSQETVGFILSVGSVGSLLGVLLYQNLLKDCPFRSVLFWCQLLSGIAGMLDLVLVLRLNLRVGIPDYFLVVIDESVSQLIGNLKWMPLLVLSSKLCPPGIEGTFFALLMSIDNAGLLTSSWGGGLLLHILRVTRKDFTNLWGAILIRNMMRLLPLTFLFLVPNIDQHSTVLPADILVENGNTKTHEVKTNDIELLSLVNSSEIGVEKA